MKWIGLTGGIGTGKTTVSNMIQSLGYKVVNADLVAHEALKKESGVFDKIIKTFGEGILNSQGEIDRKKLGDIVFKDKFMLGKLESIVHPYIQTEVLKQKTSLEKAGIEMAFYDVPLLYEKKMEKKFDKIVLVTCKKDLQIRRTIQRSGMTEDEVKRRITLQIPLENKARVAHYVIRNDGALEELQMKVQDTILSLKKDLKLV